ncbi:ribonuclease HII [Bifidobacterium simiarum]|uniref:Ribonuclease n=1 Tax=Bifidobacterium simiarum TaxID=2045441 RepID=A0A2M9HCS5_9BIFI|nr:ribonuclease HII [Bifidobacterium simiarum]PJM74610.1 ribonuclease HII [Bifidobacterium simiarum]
MATVVPRVAPTLDMERKLAGKGHTLIIGFDEVGRGSLAGPVMVGAAALLVRDLDEWDVPSGVADSKMLTEVRRESLLKPLQNWTAAWAVGSASAPEIDEWGITYALGVASVRAINEIETLLTTGAHTPLGIGMDEARALGKRGIAPDWHGTIAALGGEERELTLGVVPDDPILPRRELRVAGILDGPNDYITPVVNSFDAPELLEPIAMTTKVKGDRHCATVATAAVISKVLRDHLIEGLAAVHPEWEAYGWSSNKGYGSAAHRKALAELGVTPYHRTTWHLV